jgi:dihydroorotate dehydrogenase electron transfer subunit
VRATVAYNRLISTGYLHLGLASPDFPTTFRAGEFVMVRPPWTGDPFLPRAFSIYRVSGGGSLLPEDPPRIVEILYKVLGKGTQYLARMEPRQEVDILGPLGNAFAPPDQGVLPILVAGGIGVPPIAALARQFRNAKCEIRNVEVFLGGKTSEDILCVKDFEEAGASPHITTEDGSLGTRGLLTDLLRPFLFTTQVTRLRMYACGPSGMLTAVARLAEERAVPCQVSVEANMACGFGACMGCAIEVKADVRGYKLVCKDGPVFDSREIVWR